MRLIGGVQECFGMVFIVVWVSDEGSVRLSEQEGNSWEVDLGRGTPGKRNLYENILV